MKSTVNESDTNDTSEEDEIPTKRMKSFGRRSSETSLEEGEISSKRMKLNEEEIGEADVSLGFILNNKSVMASNAYEDDWDDVYIFRKIAVNKDENGNQNCVENISEVGKLRHIKQMLKEWKARKANSVVTKKFDSKKTIDEYLSLTSRKQLTHEMNLGDYHRWMKTEASPLNKSRTLSVLKMNFPSKWDPEANRKGAIKLVNNPKVVFDQILKELAYSSSVLEYKDRKASYNLCVTILSKPNWSFFGKGSTIDEALDDAAQYAIQFMLLMCE